MKSLLLLYVQLIFSFRKKAGNRLKIIIVIYLSTMFKPKQIYPYWLLSTSISSVYIDTGVGQSNPIIVTVITSGPAMQRTWRIRITQIPCTSIAKADQGCLQYHSGVYGRVRSFNFDTTNGRQLSNQEYSICVRTERNFCSIQYQSCPDLGESIMV